MQEELPKWEYRCEGIPHAWQEWLDMLEAMGAQGWEHYLTDQNIAHFKRRKILTYNTE